MNDAPSLDAYKQIWTAPRGLLWTRNGDIRYVGAGVIQDAIRQYINELAFAISGITEEAPLDIEIEWASLMPLAEVDLRSDIVPSQGNARAHRES